MELLFKCVAHDAAVLISQKCFLLGFGQYVFRIQLQKVLSLNGKVREFAVGVVEIAHTPKIVCSSDPLHSQHGRDALLVCVRQAIKGADAIACNQRGCVLAEGPMQRCHECLQGAEEKNAYGNTGSRARGPNPVLPEVFQNEGYPLHGQAPSTVAEATPKSKTAPRRRRHTWCEPPASRSIRNADRSDVKWFAVSISRPTLT